MGRGGRGDIGDMVIWYGDGDGDGNDGGGHGSSGKWGLRRRLEGEREGRSAA
jgi:hypothetical protein